MNAIAEIIQEWLDRERRNQAFLAHLANVSDVSVSGIMTGRRAPGPRLCRKLEKAMGLAPGTLQALRAQMTLPLNGGG